ncbi:hypothetical protein [Arthrobacter sp. V4I6]|uniref:hypothetical protein n=1 Tax=unclassified Arthrobacter TaxID=235627 RepID=UPI0035930B26
MGVRLQIADVAEGVGGDALDEGAVFVPVVAQEGCCGFVLYRTVVLERAGTELHGGFRSAQLRRIEEAQLGADG